MNRSQSRELLAGHLSGGKRCWQPRGSTCRHPRGCAWWPGAPKSLRRAGHTKGCLSQSRTDPCGEVKHHPWAAPPRGMHPSRPKGWKKNHFGCVFPPHPRNRGEKTQSKELLAGVLPWDGGSEPPAAAQHPVPEAVGFPCAHSRLFPGGSKSSPSPKASTTISAGAAAAGFMQIPPGRSPGFSLTRAPPRLSAELPSTQPAHAGVSACPSHTAHKNLNFSSKWSRGQRETRTRHTRGASPRLQKWVLGGTVRGRSNVAGTEPRFGASSTQSTATPTPFLQL